MEDTSDTKVSTTTTSIGMPIVIESVVSSFCLFSSIFIYFKEQANVYCRALALQNVVLFYILFSIFIILLTTMLSFGGYWEYITMAYLGLWFIIKIIQIVVAVLCSRSEKFIGIPPLSTLILAKASSI